MPDNDSTVSSPGTSQAELAEALDGMSANQRHAIAEHLAAIPISWRGTLQQYVDRLHRLHDSNRDVIVYDYVDDCVPVFSAMHSTRVRGYMAVGYVIRNTLD